MAWQKFTTRLFGFDPMIKVFGDEPVIGIAERNIPGPDRSDYILVRVNKIAGSPPVDSVWLIICARHEGQIVNAFSEQIQVGVSIFKRKDGLIIEHFAFDDIDYLATASVTAEMI